MSARLFKAGGAEAFAPFSIPVKTGAVEEMAFPKETDAAAREETGTPSLNLIEIEQQAREILAATEAQAKALMAQAEARAAQIESAAQEQGLAAARAQMEQEVQAATADLRAKLAHTLSELEPLYTQIATRAERDLVRLSLAIARRVVQREVATDPDIVLTLARVALERLHPRAVATVRLHPEDFDYVNAHRHQLSSTGAIELAADTSVGRGGCIVQSEHGDIDARIEEQFARIEHGFFE
ncbi:MAG TPA: FliH/SctL family protein [Blastocatellia bacterium]|nr:FliH/SctL family protein [Blastocatellia bacterium]